MSEMLSIKRLSAEYERYRTSRFKGPVLKLLLSFFHSSRLFLSDNLSGQASALTYSTLLSAIPFLAIVFAIAKGFGFSQIINRTITGALHNQTELAGPIVDMVNTYIEHTKSGVFLGIGLVILLVTVFNMTSSIEGSLNGIWHIKRQRPVLIKAADYFSVLFLAPLLIITMSGFDIYLKTRMSYLPEFVASTSRYMMYIFPIAVSSVIFICLFKFMPNTHVRLRFAIFPGVFAGILFIVFQNICFGSQIWLSNYNAIYGSFAAIPMFLFWAHVSWCICLFSAELTYIGQNFTNIQSMQSSHSLSYEERGFASVMALSLIFRRYKEKGKAPYTSSALSYEMELPIRITNEILYQLSAKGWLITAEHDINEEIRYIPAQDLTDTRISDVISSLSGKAGADDTVQELSKFSHQWKIYQDMLSDMAHARSNLLLSEMA